MSPVKEPHYFVTHSRFRPRLFTRRASYLGLFKDAKGEKMIGEASAYYFCMPESPALIHQFNPDAKIVIMLRNPVDTVYAFHYECLFLGREHRSFADALDYQQSHPEHVPNYRQIIQQWPRQIRAYQALFGKGQVWVMLFDDFIRDTAAEYKKLLDFLDVDANFQPEFRVYNASKVPPSRVFAKISGHPLTVAAMRLCCLSPGLAQKIEAFRDTQKKEKPRPPLGLALRASLTKEFAESIDELSTLLGTNLSHWKKVGSL